MQCVFSNTYTMEATFQSYLAEAVYSMEREKRQRPESEATEVSLSAGLENHDHPALSAVAAKLSAETTAGINHGLISYIDADSDQSNGLRESELFTGAPSELKRSG